MKRRFLATVEAVAEAVRDGRKEKGWTQAALASKAGVDPQLIAELEASHMQAKLEKLLGVLKALDIHAVALPSFSSGVSLEDIDLDEELKRFS